MTEYLNSMRNYRFLAFTVCVCLLQSGCGSPAKTIESGGSESIQTVGDVDPRDINAASMDLLQSMYKTGVLAKGVNSPPIISLERKIKNDTSSRIPDDVITDAIFEELTNSGSARVQMIGGPNVSERATERAKQRQFETGEMPPEPDFLLQGQLSNVRRVAGNVKEYTFYFSLKLVDLRTGEQVWGRQTQISKQGTKASVGF